MTTNPIPMKRKRKEVNRMDVGVVSLVQNGAVPASNGFLIVQEKDRSGRDLLTICQEHIDALASTEIPAVQMATIDSLATQIRSTLFPDPVAQTGVTQTVEEELNEIRAKAGGWDVWQGFQEYLRDHCQDKDQVLQAVDELAALLKSELTAPGDNDGDEAPGQSDGDDIPTISQEATMEDEIEERYCSHCGAEVAETVEQAGQHNVDSMACPKCKKMVPAERLSVHLKGHGQSSPEASNPDMGGEREHPAVTDVIPDDGDLDETDDESDVATMSGRSRAGDELPRAKPVRQDADTEGETASEDDEDEDEDDESDEDEFALVEQEGPGLWDAFIPTRGGAHPAEPMVAQSADIAAIVRQAVDEATAPLKAQVAELVATKGSKKVSSRQADADPTAVAQGAAEEGDLWSSGPFSTLF